MKLDITDHHFNELIKKGYSMDMVILLNWINKELDISHLLTSVKIKAIYKSLLIKGLISDEGKITENGIDILEFINKRSNKKFEKKKIAKGDFDKWWEIFPSNDKFEINGKSFGPTRSFKVNKEKCRILFNKYILEKKYTIKEIINATMYDVNLKKKLSYKKGSNQLKFLQNSHTYLLNESFQGFIGLGKPVEINKKTNLGSTDI